MPEINIDIVFCMANPEHVAKLQEGVSAWNEWRSAHALVQPDLSESDFNHWGKLAYHFPDSPDAPFRNANFEDTDFGHASLRDADLRGTTLRYARLDFADLGFAHLQGAVIASASLHNTAFCCARFGRTILSDLDLHTATGLADVTHEGPSTIGIDTILASGGQIPEVFLRGCGLPIQSIAYALSVRAGAIHFYSCFISYSTKDQEFADRLHADLQEKGVRCWFAPHDIEGGKKIHEQIDSAIQIHDRLLLLLSEASMSSEWVKTEIAKARKREIKENRRMLFPVRLVGFQKVQNWECFDSDTGKDSAREIREYFIPDFSNWKDHDLYTAAFDRLIRDLSANDLSAHA